MSESNKVLADALHKLAEVIEKSPSSSASTMGNGVTVDTIQQLEIRIEDILNLIQQLTLKVDGITTSLSGVQSQVLTLRSTIRSSQRTNSPVSSTSSPNSEVVPEAETIPPSQPVIAIGPQDIKETSSEPISEDVSTEEAKESEQKITSTLSEEELSQIKVDLGNIERQITDLNFQKESGFVDDDEYSNNLAELNKNRDELLKKIG